MDKAFLCHSSKDKEYVERVAKRLGRAKVIFDAMSFRAGHDFREEIKKGLEASSLFVFFVSRTSLESTWCLYEVDEAQFKKVTGKLRGQLVIIIDPEVTFGDLPKWMQRLRAIIQTRSIQAAREIERELFAIGPASLTAKPFVGRQALQQEFVERLSVSMEVSPRIFVVSGLEGVGRRSYLDRALLDNLGLTLGPFRVLDTTSTVEDLFIWSVDETSDVMTREELAAEAAIFRSLTKTSQAAEILSRLRLICEGRFVPCLIDQGGMLNESGEIREPYASILEEFTSSDEDAYLAIAGTRAPRIEEAKFFERTLQQRVQPLRIPESRILLQQLMRHEAISLKDPEAEELTRRLGKSITVSHNYQ